MHAISFNITDNFFIVTTLKILRYHVCPEKILVENGQILRLKHSEIHLI